MLFLLAPFLVPLHKNVDFVAEQKWRINDDLLALLIKTSGPFVIFINDTRKILRRLMIEQTEEKPSSTRSCKEPMHLKA